MVIMRTGNVSVSNRHTVSLHGGHISKGHYCGNSIKTRKTDAAFRILNHVTVQVGHRSIRTDLWSDILVAVQGVVSGVTAGLVREQILLAGVGGRTQRISGSAVDSDSDEIGERLSRITSDFLRLHRTGANNRGNIGGNIFQDRIRRRHRSYIAPGASERHPRRGSVMPVGGQHVELRVCGRAGSRVKE